MLHDHHIVYMWTTECETSTSQALSSRHGAMEPGTIQG